MQIKDENFPNWLSLAIGYSATGMQTPFPQNNNSERDREFLLSLDVDLNKIKTKNKVLNAVLHTFGFLKFPAPAIKYVNGNMLFHPIYY